MDMNNSFSNSPNFIPGSIPMVMKKAHRSAFGISYQITNKIKRFDDFLYSMQTRHRNLSIGALFFVLVLLIVSQFLRNY